MPLGPCVDFKKTVLKFLDFKVSVSESVYLETFPKSTEVPDSNQSYDWLSCCDFTAYRPSDSSVYLGVHRCSSEWKAWTPPEVCGHIGLGEGSPLLNFTSAS